VQWLEKYRWPILGDLIALSVILRVVHIRSYSLVLFVIVMLGIALFAPSPSSPRQR
jgi:uncharacterized membrane protein